MDMPRTVMDYVTENAHNFCNYMSDSSTYCVNCECSKHYIQDRRGCTEFGIPSESCDSFLSLNTVYDAIDVETEKYFGTIESISDKKTLIDPLDDTAMLKAINEFAKRHKYSIICIPDKSEYKGSYQDLGIDINKMVNDNFWELI